MLLQWNIDVNVNVLGIKCVFLPESMCDAQQSVVGSAPTSTSAQFPMTSPDLCGAKLKCGALGHRTKTWRDVQRAVWTAEPSVEELPASGSPVDVLQSLQVSSLTSYECQVFRCAILGRLHCRHRTLVSAIVGSDRTEHTRGWQPYHSGTRVNQLIFCNFAWCMNASVTYVPDMFTMKIWQLSMWDCIVSLQATHGQTSVGKGCWGQTEAQYLYWNIGCKMRDFCGGYLCNWCSRSRQNDWFQCGFGNLKMAANVVCVGDLGNCIRFFGSG